MSCSKDDLHNTNCNQSGFLPFSPYSVYFLQDCSMFHCHRLQEEQEIVAIKFLWNWNITCSGHCEILWSIDRRLYVQDRKRERFVPGNHCLLRRANQKVPGHHDVQIHLDCNRNCHQSWLPLQHPQLIYLGTQKLPQHPTAHQPIQSTKQWVSESWKLGRFWWMF